MIKRKDFALTFKAENVRGENEHIQYTQNFRPKKKVYSEPSKNGDTVQKFHEGGKQPTKIKSIIAREKKRITTKFQAYKLPD